MSAPPPPRIEGATHRWVELDDVTLHVAVRDGAEPAVVAVHDFPRHHWMWRGLDAGPQRLVLPDLRGSGWSHAPTGAYATATLAEDLLWVIDRTCAQGVTAVACGDGIRVVMAAAARSPDRFAKVVLLGEPPPPSVRIATLFTGAAVRKGLLLPAGTEAVYREPLRDHHRAYAAVRRQRTLWLRERGPVPEPSSRVVVVRAPPLDPERSPAEVSALL